MTNLSRRGLLGMFAAGVGAAIVAPGIIMPIKPALVASPPMTATGITMLMNQANAYLDHQMDAFRYLFTDEMERRWHDDLARYASMYATGTPVPVIA